jgi:hypothetical protein
LIQNRPRQADSFGDGSFADLAAAPALDDKVPRQAPFHVGHENPGPFEGEATVTDRRIGDNELAQFNPL